MRNLHYYRHASPPPFRVIKKNIKSILFFVEILTLGQLAGLSGSVAQSRGLNTAHHPAGSESRSQHGSPTHNVH